MCQRLLCTLATLQPHRNIQGGCSTRTHCGPLRMRGVLKAHCFILFRLCSLMTRLPSVGMQSTYRLYSNNASVFLRRALAWTTRCVNTRGSSAQKSSWIRGTQYWETRRGGLPGGGREGERDTQSGTLGWSTGFCLALPQLLPLSKLSLLS